MLVGGVKNPLEKNMFVKLDHEPLSIRDEK